MSFLSYELMYWLCDPAFWVSSRPIVLHPERARLKEGFILASNHISPLDPPLIVRHAYPRHVDFVSIVEFKQKRFVRWFFNCFNVVYLDRGGRNPATLLQVTHRLQKGRAVAMFPEGNIRSVANSVLNGGPMKDGVARLAQIAQVAVVPCVILGSEQYTRTSSWAPLKRTRYGINFGQPLRIRSELEKARAIELFLQDLREAFSGLQNELCHAMGRPCPEPLTPGAASPAGPVP